MRCSRSIVFRYCLLLMVFVSAIAIMLMVLSWTDAAAALGSLLGSEFASTSAAPLPAGGSASAPLTVAYWAENLRSILQKGEGYSLPPAGYVLSVVFGFAELVHLFFLLRPSYFEF